MPVTHGVTGSSPVRLSLIHISLGNGLYLNGDFNAVQQYILDGKPIEGVIRFFAGYAGWDHGQLAKEIKENSWLIGKVAEVLVEQRFFPGFSYEP